MNKGKQWKWGKKIRKELEKQGAEPLKINIINLISKIDRRRKSVKAIPKRLRGICLNLPPGSYVEFKSTKMGKNHAYKLDKEVKKK